MTTLPTNNFEDVDLALRIRLAGGSRRRAPRAPGVLRELVWCSGQLTMDGSLGSISGRVHGFQARPEVDSYPSKVLTGASSLVATIARRFRGRLRIRRRSG